MAYRKADRPALSAEEEELQKLAQAGRRVLRGQAEEDREAELALQIAERASLASQDLNRLRGLGRRARPAQAALVIGTTVCAFSGLGGYLFYQSSLPVALWVNLLFWIVIVPSVLPAIFLERWMALHVGRTFDGKQAAWIAAQDFKIVASPWDMYDSESKLRLVVHFEDKKPEAEMLANALRAVSTDVLVEVLALLGEEPEPDESDSPRSLDALLGTPESLSDMRAQAILSASGGGFVVAITHRQNRYAEKWLEGWMKEAMGAAFRTIHRAYPIETLKLVE